jgi:hypothetical protein
LNELAEDDDDDVVVVDKLFDFSSMPPLRNAELLGCEMGAVI